MYIIKKLNMFINIKMKEILYTSCTPKCVLEYYKTRYQQQWRKNMNEKTDI